jgi:hypothetical protein
MSVLITTSPERIGWSLSITRKTDKGFFQYYGAVESDVCILSGVEDLVPVLQPNSSRFKHISTALGYTIHRYRPRIEKLFARIERWTSQADGDVHWRSISKDNILTLYSMDINSCIAEPADAKQTDSRAYQTSEKDRPSPPPSSSCGEVDRRSLLTILQLRFSIFKVPSQHSKGTSPIYKENDSHYQIIRFLICAEPLEKQ